MEFLQKPEVIALLKASFDYGNREAHLALLTMYATGARVSQVIALKGCDIIPDPSTGGYRIRIGAAKRGRTRTFRVLVSPNPALDMRDLVALAHQRGTSMLFGGLTRHYLHVLIKKFAKTAGLHERYARLRAHPAHRRGLWLPGSLGPRCRVHLRSRERRPTRRRSDGCRLRPA